jgi:ribosomal protein L27
MTWAADGNVGIGTTSPAAPLQVNTTASDAATLILNTTHASSKRCRLQFAYGGTLGWEWGTDTGMNGTTDMYAYNRASGTVVMTMLDGGNVGIGTTAPATALDVVGDLTVGTSNAQILGPASGAASAGNVSYSFSGDTDTGFFRWNTNTFSAATAGATRMTWAADGNVGIGKTAPNAKLSLGTSTGKDKLLIYDGGGVNSLYAGFGIDVPAGNDFTMYAHNSGVLKFGKMGTDWSTLTTWMTITNAGNVGIGTTAPNNTLDVIGDLFVGDTTRDYTGTASYGGLCFPRGEILFSNTNTQNQMYFCSNLTMGADGGFDAINTGMSGFMAVDNGTIAMGTAPSVAAGAAPSFTTRLSIANTGLVSVGALSKTSGTFDIPHPTRGGDWRLRHSFIEGPQADLIYRGTVTLSGGTATVDLDAVSDMTDGTWVALCRDPWAMVASSGNAVEWSLSGKTLTVTSDTADAVCSWMVIAERQDDHMKSAEGVLADDDGHIIVEYEKEPSPPILPIEALESA